MKAVEVSKLTDLSLKLAEMQITVARQAQTLETREARCAAAGEIKVIDYAIGLITYMIEKESVDVELKEPSKTSKERNKREQ